MICQSLTSHLARSFSINGFGIRIIKMSLEFFTLKVNLELNGSSGIVFTIKFDQSDITFLHNIYAEIILAKSNNR